MRGKIIALSGFDGCGKSTMATALKEKLRAQGQPAVTRWATLRPVLLKPAILAAKWLLVRGRDKFQDYSAHMAAKTTGMRKLSWTHEILLLIMLVDYIPQFFGKVVLSRWIGRHVICDRYYHDLMLDYTLLVNGDTRKMHRLIRLGARLFPRPDLHYFVDVPVDVALARKNDIPSRDYLIERQLYYSEMAKEQTLAPLSGTRPIDENVELILSDLRRVRHA